MLICVKFTAVNECLNNIIFPIMKSSLFAFATLFAAITADSSEEKRTNFQDLLQPQNETDFFGSFDNSTNSSLLYQYRTKEDPSGDFERTLIIDSTNSAVSYNLSLTQICAEYKQGLLSNNDTEFGALLINVTFGADNWQEITENQSLPVHFDFIVLRLPRACQSQSSFNISSLRVAKRLGLQIPKLCPLESESRKVTRRNNAKKSVQIEDPEAQNRTKRQVPNRTKEPNSDVETTLHSVTNPTTVPPVATDPDLSGIPDLVYYIANVPENDTIVIDVLNVSSRPELFTEEIFETLLDHRHVVVQRGLICKELSSKLCSQQIKPLNFFNISYDGDSDHVEINAGIDCASLSSSGLTLQELQDTLERDKTNNSAASEILTKTLPKEDGGENKAQERGFGGSHLLAYLTNIKYDGRSLPSILGGQQVRVTLAVYIESIANFKASTMDYELDLYLEMVWRDVRFYKMPFSPFVLVKEQDIIDMLWMPDPYFANSKESQFHTVTSKNQVARVYPDGMVYYSVRVRLKPSCNLFLCKYPHDHQTCDLIIRSFGNPKNTVAFYWLKENNVTMNPNIAFPEMYVEKIKATECQDQPQILGNTSCARIVFHLRRETGFFTAQIYIPTSITLMFSWISVWLPVEFIEGRIGVAITVLLIVATEANGARENLPFVSYTKAIDLWLSFIKGFVFTTLIQTLLVLSLARKAAVMEGWSRKKTFTREERDELEDRATFFYQAAHWLDLCCRILYPIIFVGFLVHYFTIYISGSQSDCLSGRNYSEAV